jgi:putative ABC transport system ATP-binding protein
VSLEVAAGEFLAIMGPSGSGKSSLLHLIGGLDRPTSGSVAVDGRALQTLNETGLALYRRAQVGFVFQFFNLIANLTVRDNIELPALLNKARPPEAARRAAQLMDRLGIAAQADKLPAQLSGGQRQRVAIARALVNQPSLLLADEPTGNLDSAAGSEVLRLFQELHAQGQTIVLVTHDPAAAAYAGRVIFLRDGQICGDASGLSRAEIAFRLSELAHPA